MARNNTLIPIYDIASRKYAQTNLQVDMVSLFKVDIFKCNFHKCDFIDYYMDRIKIFFSYIDVTEDFFKLWRFITIVIYKYVSHNYVHVNMSLLHDLCCIMDGANSRSI